MAIPSVAAFRTPLGDVSLDSELLARAAELPGVTVFDEAHAAEHSLEVQLPFLQRVLEDFTLLPVVVGGATPDQVAGLLEALWGDDDTLIVISSDLSHYHDYATASERDARTTAAIELLDGRELDGYDACGARPVAGLLQLARQLGLRATTLDLRNSGDTQGNKDRVVGYGAWSFVPAETATLPANQRNELLRIAMQALIHRTRSGREARVKLDSFARPLQNLRASFVTLTRDAKLRGCIGSLQARRPLCADVVANAQAAGFQDPRFAPLTEAELPELGVEVSILSAPAPMQFDDEAGLLAQLRPGRDGLIISDGEHRATFLPSVWEQLPEPGDFLARLKAKAGLEASHWSDSFRAERYVAEKFGARLPSMMLEPRR